MKYLGIKRHDSANNSQMVQEKHLVDVHLCVWIERDIWQSGNGEFD